MRRLYERWADLVLAKTAPGASWDDVDLGDYLAGPLLAHIAQVHRQRAAAGEVLRRPVHSVARHTVLSVRLHGAAATLETCEVDDGIVESRDGVVLNDEVSTFHDTWTARPLGGVWKLTASTRLAMRQGVWDCGDN